MKQQRGNILFLILLAIILFVALTYAVNSGMRGGGKDAGDEKSSAIAAQAIQYMSLVENTIRRTMLVNGIPDYGLDMSGMGTASNNTANATCTNKDCRIFNSSSTEGLINRQALMEEAYALPGNRYAIMTVVQVHDVGTAEPDLIYYYQNIKKSVCEELNRKLGQTIDLTTAELFGSTYYNGTLTSFPSTSNQLGDQVPSLKGKSSGCFYHASVGYIIYHVMLAR